MHRQWYIHLLSVSLVLAAGSAFAAPAKKPAKPPAKAPAKAPAPNQVKGQTQLAGANGQFGVVYSLQNGFNFAILSARYAVEPLVAYETLSPETDQKLVVLDIAIKNARPEDNFFATDDLFTLVDETGELYPHRSITLISKGSALLDLTLRPGQGVGQPERKDPLRVGFAVSAKARIVKIMVNVGRVGKQDEKVLRYYAAGATKAEAGEAGNPKNVIAPLPDAVRDPSHPSGAVALGEGKGSQGAYHPSGQFALRLDSLTYSTETLVDGNAPEEGKRYAVATITAKCLTDSTPSMFDVTCPDEPLYEITTTEGQRQKPIAFRKAKQDEDPECEFRRGDEYTFRVIFMLPQESTARKLVLGAGRSRKWALDVSGVK